MNTELKDVIGTDVSAEERRRASDYLGSTRSDLLDALAGFDQSQFHFKPEPDCWSPLEILEHLVIIEERLHGIISHMAEAPRANPSDAVGEVEARILTQVPSRELRFKAPPQISPSGQWEPEEAIERFVQQRTRTQELLESAPALRGHVVPHPVMGPWDGYQWILATAAHTARHTRQLVELKAHGCFPAQGSC